jgi:hypothetical protein
MVRTELSSPEFFDQRHVVTLEKRQCRRNYPVLESWIVRLSEWKTKRIRDVE